jgi:ABC-type sugar transport system permease subunit
MTVAEATTKPPPRPIRVTGDEGVVSRAAARLLPFVPLVQAVLTVVGLAALVAILVAGPRDLAPPLYLFLLSVPLLFTVGAGLSTIWTLRRTSRGRVLAIIVDYLAFLAAFLLLLHLLGVFVGFDDLADVFGGTLPWLALALLAFVLGYALDAFKGRPGLQRGINLLRRGLFVVAAVGCLVAIDAAHGALEMLKDLGDPLNLTLAVVSIVLLAFIVALWGPAAQRRFGATLREGDILFGVLLISPALLGFLGFFAGPLLFSLYVSMSEWDAFSEPVFTGLQNYLDIVALQFVVLDDPSVLLAPGLQAGYSEIARLGPLVVAAQDKLFWIALRNIFVFAIIAIPLAVIPALFVASLLNTKLRGIRVFRAIYFIPSVAGVVGIAIIWKQLLDQTVGWINYLITMGVDALNTVFGLAIVDPKVGWLSDPATALAVIAVVFAWTTVGFNAILFLAGLQGIPADLYEAATIDGANRWQRFLSITLPSVAPTTFFVVATTTILAFQLFTEPYVLTSPNPGGPNNATLTPVMYLYNSGFKNFEFGYASAVAWVLFGIIFVFTIIQYRRQRAEAVGS